MKQRYITNLSKLALLTATVIWGTSFFIMEGTIENIGIFTLLAVRFSFAAMLMAAALNKKLRSIDREYLLYGFIMGAFVIAAYTAQTFGLADDGTTPGKNAFLTAIYCVIVPFVYWFVARRKPDRYNITAAFLCIMGVTLISVSGNDFSSVCAGDILTLMGGLFFSFHMVAVSIFSQKKDILILTMLQFLFAGIIAWIPAVLTEEIPRSPDYTTVLSVIYLALMPTFVCYILQNVGQKFTPPSTAALIMSMEAVFGVLFSVIFTSERLYPKTAAGFLIVLAAILISELKPRFLGGKARMNTDRY